jgi:hypothetical protein
MILVPLDKIIANSKKQIYVFRGSYSHPSIMFPALEKNLQFSTTPFAGFQPLPKQTSLKTKKKER